MKGIARQIRKEQRRRAFLMLMELDKDQRLRYKRADKNRILARPTDSKIERKKPGAKND